YLRNVHELHAELLGKDGQHVLLAGKTPVNKDLMDRLVWCRALHLVQLGQIFLTKLPFLDELLKQCHANLKRVCACSAGYLLECGRNNEGGIKMASFGKRILSLLRQLQR